MRIYATELQVTRPSSGFHFQSLSADFGGDRLVRRSQILDEARGLPSEKSKSTGDSYELDRRNMVTKLVMEPGYYDVCKPKTALREMVNSNVVIIEGR